MTQSLWLLVSLAVVACTAVAVSVVAARISVVCSRRCWSASATIDGWKRCEQKLGQVTERQTELADQVVHLNDRYETLRTRVGMREVRAARDAPKDEANGNWKDDARKKLLVAISKAQPTEK